MKIVSKYKDFYDYMYQDNDPDIVYIRNPWLSTDNIVKGYPRSHYYNDSDITVQEAIFGIYPYVYVVPFAKIRIKCNGYSEYFVYFFDKDDLDNIVSAKDMENFCKTKAIEYVKASKYPALYRPLEKYVYHTFKKNVGKLIKDEFAYKKEITDVFVKINAPVFCEWDSLIIDKDPYYDLEDIRGRSNKSIDAKFIVNCSFNKLGKEIMTYYINDIMNSNIYNDIENFLWSIKQEPIANPDNKTKILAHGFDLKTSFRKM